MLFNDDCITYNVRKFKSAYYSNINNLAVLKGDFRMSKKNHAEVVIIGGGIVGCAIAYYVLQTRIIRCEGKAGLLAKAIGRDLKGKISPVLYLCGIAAAWIASPAIGVAFFVLVAVMWLVPDRRLERALARPRENE